LLLDPEVQDVVDEMVLILRARAEKQRSDALRQQLEKALRS
jgi:hypothetical protein